MTQPYQIAANYLLNRVPNRPQIGIVCGSGLSGLSKSIDNPNTIKYEDVPGFPSTTVAGHKGELVFGTINGIEVVCMGGRFHFYEGNPMQTVALPSRVMRLLGVRLLIVTNASGGLNPTYNAGDISIIQDHFAAPLIAGMNPLVGPNDDSLGPRFPAVSDTYDPELQKITMKCAKELAIKGIHENGTYCFVSGPSYESMAECKFLRSIGGDMVGMSTVPEIIAAKHVGMKVLGLALITNKVVLEKQEETVHCSHAEVLEAVTNSGKRVENLVKAIISKEMIGNYLDKLPAVNYVPKSVSVLETLQSLCTSFLNPPDNAYARTAILGGILGFTFVMGGKLAKRI